MHNSLGQPPDGESSLKLRDEVHRSKFLIEYFNKQLKTMKKNDQRHIIYIRMLTHYKENHEKLITQYENALMEELL